jgi:hypothetical protein
MDVIKNRIIRKFIFSKEINGIKKYFQLIKINQELVKSTYYDPYEKKLIEEVKWIDKNFN